MLADFHQLAAMSEQIVSDFVGRVVEGVAVGMPSEELVRLRMSVARLERACDLALERRGVSSF